MLFVCWLVFNLQNCGYIFLQSLDGQNIYNGCCTLRIDFSKLSNLTVKFNNEKTRYIRHDTINQTVKDIVCILIEIIHVLSFQQVKMKLWPSHQFLVQLCLISLQLLLVRYVCTVLCFDWCTINGYNSS